MRSTAGIRVFVQLIPDADNPPKGFFGVMYKNHPKPYEWGVRRGPSPISALFHALVAGMSTVSHFKEEDVSVFLPSRALNPHLFRLHKHHHLPLSAQLTSLLSDYLAHGSHTVTFMWYSVKWAHLPTLPTLSSVAAVRLSPVRGHIFPNPEPDFRSGSQISANLNWTLCEPEIGRAHV